MPLPPESVSVRNHMAAVAVVVVAALAVPFLLLPVVGPRRSAAAPASDAPCPDYVPGLLLTDGLPLAYDMSRGPVEGQETGECQPPERKFHGGCWIALQDVRPSGNPPKCSYGSFQEGKCWGPVGKRTRPRTSINRR